MKSHRLLAATALLSLSLTAAFADDPDPNQVQWKTDHVVVFKNGRALVVKHGKARADARGSVYTTEVPDAVLGTVWARTDQAKPLNMRSEWKSIEKTIDLGDKAALIPDLLRANIGRQITLFLGDERLDGTLDEVLESAGKCEHVVIRLADGLKRIVPVSNIRQIQGPDLTTSYQHTEKHVESIKRLSFEAGPDSANTEVAIEFCYFTGGIRWIPTYRLDQADKSTLTLQAEIINNLEDLEDTNLHLVVGVPHFRYEGEVSPLSLEASLRAILDSSAIGSNQVFMNSNFASQTIAEADAAPGMADVDFEGSQAGESSGEMHLYPITGFTLGKGGRAARHLDTFTVEPESVYRLNLRLQRGDYGEPTRLSSAGPVEVNANQVWQTLEFPNKGTAPWTTGPVLIMNNGMPVAQELLTYTAPGATATIPVTVAVNVQATHEERETARNPAGRSWRNREYAKVDKQGDLNLTNLRKEETTIRVRLSTGGLVDTASDEGAITVNDHRSSDWSGEKLPALNNHSDVEWTVTLAPGEKKTLGYTMSYFAP